MCWTLVTRVETNLAGVAENDSERAPRPSSILRGLHAEIAIIVCVDWLCVGLAAIACPVATLGLRTTTLAVTHLSKGQESVVINKQERGDANAGIVELARGENWNKRKCLRSSSDREGRS